MKTVLKYKWLLVLIAVIICIITAFFSDYTLRFFFPEKVWVHKVNTLEKLFAVASRYQGLELDIVYDETKHDFDVHHPPEPSTGLWLSAYFQSLANKQQPLWLDFKNLNSENQNAACRCLDSLAQHYQLNKSLIIVESPAPEYLIDFNKYGFKTSYYLPPELHERTDHALNVEIKFAKHQAISYPTTYLSTEFKDYPILKHYFHDQKKIIWFNVYGSMNKIKARLLLFDILNDPTVDVLLVSE